MPACAVIGGQWGDEGKGKIVDYLAQKAHAVVRYAGGGNAGHSVENGAGKFVLRTVPCGIFSPKTELNIIGCGTVPNIEVVVTELKALEDKGIDFRSLRIDIAAHLVIPWHIVEDNLQEERRGNDKIGTTGNGIPPCYADKVKLIGLRAGDLLDFPGFKKKFLRTYREKKVLFKKIYKRTHALKDPDTIINELEGQLEYLGRKFGSLDNLICDTPPLLWEALDKGQNVLLEGAQGFLLDIDHGTYPYVTSSCTGVASAVQGSGVPVSLITERIGVVKAYMTRVGAGDFRTQMTLGEEKKIRELAQEYGTVTGRPRRCGWFDTEYFKRAARMNDLTSCAITRLDILDDFPLLGVGVRDGKDGIRIERIQGWGPSQKVMGCKTWEDLPQSARDYCERIACGVPIKIVSIGPKRDQTIVLR